MIEVGLLTRRPDAWCSSQLARAFRELGARVHFLRFNRLAGRVGARPLASHRSPDVAELAKLDALVVRPIGRGSLEEIIFRMDLLRRLEAEGVLIVNPAEAIEICSDKYRALWHVELAGLPVPRTVATEDVRSAMRAFWELGGDVVVKPIFGSRGVGSVRVTDPETALRVFRAIAFQHGVIYIQEFVPHGPYDIRAFVLGGCVLAAMRRVARAWKKNIYQGARPEPHELPEDLADFIGHGSLSAILPHGVQEIVFHGPHLRSSLMIDVYELSRNPGVPCHEQSSGLSEQGGIPLSPMGKYGIIALEMAVPESLWNFRRTWHCNFRLGWTGPRGNYASDFYRTWADHSRRFSCLCGASRQRHVLLDGSGRSGADGPCYRVLAR